MNPHERRRGARYASTERGAEFPILLCCAVLHCTALRCLVGMAPEAASGCRTEKESRHFLIPVAPAAHSQGSQQGELSKMRSRTLQSLLKSRVERAKMIKYLQQENLF